MFIQRSGTYRSWKDKVRVIRFPEKVSPGSEETKLFYKKRLQLQGAGNVSPFGSCIPGAWNTHVPKHAGARHLRGGERKERLNA